MVFGNKGRKNRKLLGQVKEHRFSKQLTSRIKLDACLLAYHAGQIRPP
jgi:hypothetical protein